MKDAVYPYDRELYSRLFLNCFQRQSSVMLAERTPHLHQLFHRALISTDAIADQVIRQQRPKFDFESGYFAPEDLARIGFVRQESAFETFAEARPLILETVRRDGYAIMVGDVYYWPHCPEYRTTHLTHTLTLREFHADTGEWTVIDDNPASLLCTYRYPESVIAAGFDHGELRRVRHFTSQPYDVTEAEHGTRAAFSALLAAHQDSYRLFDGLGDLLASPWIAPERAIAALHDAFALYQGSRVLLRAYLKATAADPEPGELAGRAAGRAAAVQNQLLLGRVTGTVDANGLRTAAGEVKETERKLVAALRTLYGARPGER
ncbi:hypothetical protein ADL22_21960 [Streptomyces sp. NRRL F-4489]|uniref:hypothetical protein n=1 Tax=Streptomyces sp. NRRL F-4489 TaxID=1609095 RepID=UPI000749241A|nr:hypothetical protein [Streptomyces sp. NRRL F-4489]KUL37337.1 hypothetical protein ADL22_21960 [Streptomyces sp. NRRL F-4489]